MTDLPLAMGSSSPPPLDKFDFRSINSFNIYEKRQRYRTLIHRSHFKKEQYCQWCSNCAMDRRLCPHTRHARLSLTESFDLLL